MRTMTPKDREALDLIRAKHPTPAHLRIDHAQERVRQAPWRLADDPNDPTPRDDPPGRAERLKRRAAAREADRFRAGNVRLGQ